MARRTAIRLAFALLSRAHPRALRTTFLEAFSMYRHCMPERRVVTADLCLARAIEDVRHSRGCCRGYDFAILRCYPVQG